ncbi:MAG: anthranilate phosphoribosyltransferase, partial [Acidiferrobacterales bacterium]
KAYPPIYAMLARHAGFDSALIVRGVEGGVVPSLQQPAKVFYYHDEGEVQQILVEPTSIGISQSKRAVPIPDDLPKIKNKGDTIATTVDPDAIAKAAAEAGIAALEGKGGPAYDSLVYAAAICLLHLKRHDSLQAAADAVHKALDSGEPLARFRAQ